MGYPVDDTDYQEFVIGQIEELGTRLRLISVDGHRSEIMAKRSDFVPEIGDMCRTYGEKFRRGLFVGEREIFHRTDAANKLGFRNLCRPQSSRLTDICELI